MREFFKKERPLLGLEGSGGGLGFFGGIKGVDYDEVVFTSPGDWVAPSDAAKFGIAIVLIASQNGSAGPPAAVAFPH